ncbi:MAG: psdD [Chlamydiia bacterium]|nr:psdD [Chlamydiia bacterium]
MQSVHYTNRKTGKIEKENVYFEEVIRFLYGKTFFSKTIGRFLLHSMAKHPFFSWLFGISQSRPASKSKVLPFIKRYAMDTTEFRDQAEDFSSFNDFFIRHLRPECRPIAATDAIIPADGRYQFFQKIGINDPFMVKGEQLSLETLLQDRQKAKLFVDGSLVIARLCPTDCHRFYFPVDCTPSKAQLIEGKLFSVNPIAIKENPWIYYKNRRVITYLETEKFGTIAYLEIGATNVGSIKQTYTPDTFYPKGSEKGYFNFGGSALIILFQKDRIQFSEDLLNLMKNDLEIRCLIGESLGKA